MLSIFCGKNHIKIYYSPRNNAIKIWPLQVGMKQPGVCLTYMGESDNLPNHLLPKL